MGEDVVEDKAIKDSDEHLTGIMKEDDPDNDESLSLDDEEDKLDEAEDSLPEDDDEKEDTLSKEEDDDEKEDALADEEDDLEDDEPEKEEDSLGDDEEDREDKDEDYPFNLDDGLAEDGEFDDEDDSFADADMGDYYPPDEDDSLSSLLEEEFPEQVAKLFENEQEPSEEAILAAFNKYYNSLEPEHGECENINNERICDIDETKWNCTKNPNDDKGLCIPP
jgi:hypothetical protein